MTRGAIRTHGGSRDIVHAAIRSCRGWCVVKRVTTNVAATVKPPSGSHARREARFLSVAQLRSLRDACATEYADVVLVLGLAGLRWGEVAGLQVGDLVDRPGRGMRVQLAVLVSRETGQLYIDTVKNKRARTVPLVEELHGLSTGGPSKRNRRPGCSRHRREGRCGKRTGCARCGGWRLRRRSGCRGCGCTTCDTLRHRSGSVPARTEGGAADSRPRIRGDENGPVRAPDRSEPLGRRETCRRRFRG